MSIQNQTASVNEKTDNLFIQKIGMTLEEIQKVIVEKVALIRRTHLLIGFAEASLANELDKNREYSKQLHNFEWNDIVEDFFASEIVSDMQARDKIIDELLLKIQSLRIALVETEKVLSADLAYKHSLIKKA